MPQPVLIATLEELDQALELSHERPVLLLKHSAICGASSSALETFHEFAGSRPDDAITFAVVVIQESRDVSDDLARRTRVRHQSPQVLLLRHGRATWNTSHWGISHENLEKAVEIVPA